MQEYIRGAVQGAFRAAIWEAISLIGWQGLGIITMSGVCMLIVHHFAREVARKLAIPVICAAIGGSLVLGVIAKPEVRIVEKPVIREVVKIDYSGQGELRQKLREVENARAIAERKAIEEQGRAQAEQDARKQAQAESLTLASQVKKLSPDSEIEEANRLKNEIDWPHAPCSRLLPKVGLPHG